MANMLNLNSSNPLPITLGGTGNSTGTAVSANNITVKEVTTNYNF